MKQSVIAITNWGRFQHYKDRDPPWVKLYRDMLTSESWVLGTDISRLVQVASILLAARYDNKIPYRWDLIKKVSSLGCSEAQFTTALQHLAETNFLEIQEVTEEEKSMLQLASNPLAKCSSEAEQSRAETEKKGSGLNGHSSATPTDVTIVFNRWKEVHSHQKAQLDDKRIKLIRVALKSYTPEQLCQSIEGYKNSPYHMGQNDRKTVYDDIEVFLRDAKHIDAGLRFAEQGGSQQWM